MTREEAINEIKSWDFLEGKEIEAIYTLIPELRESEDEKIRNEILEYFTITRSRDFVANPERQKWISYIEKQKKLDKMIVVSPEVDANLYYDNWVQYNCKTRRECFEEGIRYAQRLQKEQKPKLDEAGKLEFCKKCSRSIFQYQRGYDQGLIDGQIKTEKEQKPAECIYDNRIQYDSIKSGIEAFASTYSFNIESKLFSQLTKEQQQLWREEIEQAAIAGGENGIELSRDNRYKENRTAEWSDEEWSEEDKKRLEGAIKIVDEPQKPIDYDHEMWKNCEANFEGGKKEVINNPEKYGLQNLEWSEEDERMLSRCIKSVECSKQFADSETYKAAKDVEMNWLKSLPERFNLEPKQEWSEEDERRLNNIIHYLPLFSEDAEWIRALKNRVSS